MVSPTTPQAAPTRGAAPTAAARLLALIDQSHARDQAAQRRSSYAVAPAATTHDEPATDPARWQGFI